MSHSLTLRWRLRVWRLVIFVPPLVHFVPVHRLVARLESANNAYAAPPIEALAASVDGWLRRLPWLWRWTCLKRAIILYSLLRRGNEPVHLHIGVKREADRTFAAHAWLVRDDKPYLEPPESAFATFQVITVFPEQA